MAYLQEVAVNHNLLESQHPRIFMKPELYIQQAATTFNTTCNSHCLWCSGAVTGGKEMSIEKAKEVMNMILYEMRIKDVFIACSAELTLYSGLLELVKFSDLKKIPYLRITQDTNARYIPDGFIESLNSMKNNYWTISISLWGGNSDEWQKYQGRGDWNQQVKNIERYLSELKIPPAFSMPAITEKQKESTLNFIISEIEKSGYKYVINSNANSDTYKSYKEQGIVPINVRKFRGYVDQKEEEENGGLAGYFIHNRNNTSLIEENPYKNKNNCHFPYNSFFVDAAGYVYPCINENNHIESAIGNVNDYSPFNMKAYYEMIHSGKGMEFWRNNFIRGRFPCDDCKNCPSRDAY